MSPCLCLQIIIVDEFTGRTMPGRRWSDGLHQVRTLRGLSTGQHSLGLAAATSGSCAGMPLSLWGRPPGRAPEHTCRRATDAMEEHAGRPTRPMPLCCALSCPTPAGH